MPFNPLTGEGRLTEAELGDILTWITNGAINEKELGERTRGQLNAILEEETRRGDVQLSTPPQIEVHHGEAAPMILAASRASYRLANSPQRTLARSMPPRPLVSSRSMGFRAMRERPKTALTATRSHGGSCSSGASACRHPSSWNTEISRRRASTCSQS